jgi:hypothetical protein
MKDSDDVKAALRAAARFVGSPVWRRLRPRVEGIAARYAGQAESRAAGHADRGDAALRSELDRVRQELHDLRGVCDTVRVTADTALHEVSMIAAQAAAVDERLGALERAEPSGPVDPEARSLLAEVRSEHARIRARLTAVAGYEERIGRLEAERP